jgi:hypothetical protein
MKILGWSNAFYYINTYFKVLLGLVQVEKTTRITSDIKALEKINITGQVS